jgi:hypothetical protein
MIIAPDTTKLYGCDARDVYTVAATKLARGQRPLAPILHLLTGARHLPGLRRAGHACSPHSEVEGSAVEPVGGQVSASVGTAAIRRAINMPHAASVTRPIHTLGLCAGVVGRCGDRGDWSRSKGQYGD